MVDDEGYSTCSKGSESDSTCSEDSESDSTCSEDSDSDIGRSVIRRQSTLTMHWAQQAYQDTQEPVAHCHGEHGSPSEGHMDASLCMFIGNAHAGDLHTTGCWCGNDAHAAQPHHHYLRTPPPGLHRSLPLRQLHCPQKMPDDALLAQNMDVGPGGKHVSKQRGATCEGSDGTANQQPFVFTAGGTLLLEAKNIRARQNSIRRNPRENLGSLKF